MDIQALLAGYPRPRPELPQAYRDIYARECRLNRGGGTWINRLAMSLESWMHRIIARRGGRGGILEIGAGSLNHVPFEPARDYDAVEPFEPLYAESPHRGKVRRIYKDISEIPSQARYRRVISVAVLEHLERLPEVIARSALLLEDGGLSQHGIPSEGGFLWDLSWRLTTGVAYRLRNGLPYGVLMRHEHINDALEIIEVLRWFYEKVAIRRFPLPFHHLSFYAYIEASGPRRERCRDYLARLAPAAAGARS